MSRYGDVDVVVETLQRQLENSPFLLGDNPSAADVRRGSALEWIIGFGLVPNTDSFQAYVDRIASRPASVARRDVEVAAEHERAVAAPSPLTSPA